MNLASAGPLLSIWLGRRPDTENDRNTTRSSLGRNLAWTSVWAMLLGMLTGGMLLYFTPSPGLIAAIQRLPVRDLWFAGAELAFTLVCLLLYASLWQPLRSHRRWHAVLALMSVTNLLYHFPPLMSILGKLAANPRWAKAEVLDRAALLQLMQRSEVLALSAHFILASIAVSAVAVLWLQSKPLPKVDDDAPTDWLARRAASIALLTSALQIPVGIWLLASLPQKSQAAMMGASLLASLSFLGALVFTYLLLQQLLNIAIGSAPQTKLRSAGWFLVVLVLLMTTTLQSTRIQRHTSPKQEIVSQQNHGPDRSNQEKSREAYSSTASE